MKIRVLCAMLLALLIHSVSAETSSSEKIKVLVFTGGHQFKAEPFFQVFKDDPEITFDTGVQTDSAEAYEREDLYKFDVLVLYDSPSVLTETQRARFLALFEKGIGVIVLHHALLSYPLWEEYERIAGGKYVYLDKQMKNGIQSSQCKANVDIPVTVIAKDHPITTGLQDFVLRDELYSNMHMLADVTPLMKTGDELLAWARTEKNSRVVGTIVGHGPSAYQDPNFRKLLWQSIRWVAKKS